jgi:hypothetical protein
MQYHCNVVGATGFEPVSEIDATTNGSCGCEFCQGYRAANALHSRHSNCLDVALLDADLQRVIAAWDGLPAAIRRAALALISTSG